LLKTITRTLPCIYRHWADIGNVRSGAAGIFVYAGAIYNTFQQSAHSPLFEEPERFLRIMMEDVKNGTIDLADKELRGDE
jgi:hypothetical protein